MHIRANVCVRACNSLYVGMHEVRTIDANETQTHTVLLRRRSHRCQVKNER